MKHDASPDFWSSLDQLPQGVQKVAHQNYELLRNDARHPSLHLKRAAGYWSVRIGSHYRALGKELPDGILWVWIGTHAEYDRLIG